MTISLLEIIFCHAVWIARRQEDIECLLPYTSALGRVLESFVSDEFAGHIAEGYWK